MSEPWTLQAEGVLMRIGMASHRMPQKKWRYWDHMRRDTVKLLMVATMTASALWGVVSRPDIWYAFAFCLAPVVAILIVEYILVRRMWNDVDRVMDWRERAFGVGLHIACPLSPGDYRHNVEVARELLVRSRLEGITHEEVVNVARLASLTSRRNALLIGTYLRLMLLAEAEEVRQKMRSRAYWNDFDPQVFWANRISMSTLPGKGRAPLTGEFFKGATRATRSECGLTRYDHVK